MKNDIMTETLAEIGVDEVPGTTEGGEPVVHSADRTAASGYGRLTQIKVVIRLPPTHELNQERPFVIQGVRSGSPGNHVDGGSWIEILLGRRVTRWLRL